MRYHHSSFMEHPFRKNQLLLLHNQIHQKRIISPKVILLASTLTILTIIPLLVYHPFLRYPSIQLKNSSSSSYSAPTLSSSSTSSSSSVNLSRSSKKCDIFKGKWVWNPDEVPPYTDSTCTTIQAHQNCKKYGKPNSDLLTRWKWKPDECELPNFDPQKFFQIVRGKSLAFVGDSIARNQMQSLICLLSKAESPVEDLSYASNNVQSKRWRFTNNNFTISILWSPYLVRTKERIPQKGRFNLYLDEVDNDWIGLIDEFDYVIISAGQWFFRPSVFYENGQLVGCLWCGEKNITELPLTYGYRKAFRTAFKALHNSKNFKGTTFLRTFSPSHFENGLWDEGGNCIRTRPFFSNETRFEGEVLDMYTTQVEEFRVGEEGEKKGLKFRLIDSTKAMFFRPDAHPSKYWHGVEENSIYEDCVHWCLPGPVDIWNDFLLEILKEDVSGD